MPKLSDRLRNSWNAFLGRDPITLRGGSFNNYGSFGGMTGRPDRYQLTRNNSRNIVAAIYNQIAVDVSSVDIKHVIIDENGDFSSVVKDSLNDLFSLEANADQTGRELIRDIALSMFDEGCLALVPIETDVDPRYTDAYKVLTARTGKILEWYPKHIRVEVYNEYTGKKQELVVEKRYTPIFENPFYSTMNGPNAVAQRLIRVLNQLDRTNDQNSAGKIDLLVQLPYAVRGKARENQAEERRKSLENQLAGSQYGIGYIDVSEKVIQLNRSVENNLWEQSKELLTELYNELGFSQEIFNGTAKEEVMINYNNRTISPVLTTITEEIKRKWLSKTAITQGHSIMFFNDPFKLMPISQIAENADKFTRNEIMSSNEFRRKIGLRPSEDPNADLLRNSNLNHPEEQNGMMPEEGTVEENPEMIDQNAEIGSVDVNQFITPEDVINASNGQESGAMQNGEITDEFIDEVVERILNRINEGSE